MLLISKMYNFVYSPCQCYAAYSEAPKKVVEQTLNNQEPSEILSDDRKKNLIKVVSLVFCTVIGLYLVKEPVKALKRKFEPPDPCISSISTYWVNLTGDCTVEEINLAYETQKNLSDARERELKEIGISEAAAYSKKAQEKIDALEAANEEWRRACDERFRKITNPTPEERAALRAEVACELDEHFRGWLGYLPRCKTIERNILDVSLSDDCSKIRAQFRKLSLLYHPDKNNSTEAKDKFFAINNAYEKLCPPEASEALEPEIVD